MNLVKLVSCSATCVLLFLAGSIFSIGVLAKASASDRTWEASFSTMALVSAAAMVLTGLYIDGSTHNRHADESEKSSKTRMLIWISSFAFVMLSLGSFRSPVMIRFAVSVQGIPLGTLFLLGNELLGDWMSTCPGIGIGIGQMAFGMGTIVFSIVFSTLCALLGSGAVVLSGVMLAIPTLLLSFLITYPHRALGRSLHARKSAGGDVLAPLLNEKGIKLSWQKLVSERTFWLYLLLVFVAQAGFSFLPLFFKLGTSFGGSPTTVVRLFQFASFFSTGGRLATGVLTGLLSFGSTGRFSSGSKNLLQLIFATQIALFAWLIWLSKKSDFYGTMRAATAVIVAHSAANCSCALLARDMFSSENSATVFGVGAGLMMGVGEAVSSGVGSWLVGTYGAGPQNTGFTILYIVLCFWSVAGFSSAILITKCEIAFSRLHRVSYISICDVEEAMGTDSRNEITEERIGFEPLFSKCDLKSRHQVVNIDFRVAIAV